MLIQKRDLDLHVLLDLSLVLMLFVESLDISAVVDNWEQFQHRPNAKELNAPCPGQPLGDGEAVGCYTSHQVPGSDGLERMQTDGKVDPAPDGGHASHFLEGPLEDGDLCVGEEVDVEGA